MAEMEDQSIEFSPFPRAQECCPHSSIWNQISNCIGTEYSFFFGEGAETREMVIFSGTPITVQKNPQQSIFFLYSFAAFQFYRHTPTFFYFCSNDVGLLLSRSLFVGRFGEGGKENLTKKVF